MKLNSSQLEAFFAVAKILNFTKAAETLHVTQSALSQRIAKLEADLGTTLFIRDRSSIRLTEAGVQVLRYCQFSEAVESELLAKLQDSKEDLAGTIRIGGFSSVTRSLAIPSLKKIMHHNPRLSIQLITKEIQDLRTLLNNAEVDYILTSKKSDSPNIESIFLGYEKNVLVKLKKAAETNIYLDHDANAPTTKAYFSQHKTSFKPSNIRYLDDVYGLIDGVKNNYGKAILPLHLIAKEKDLEIIDPKKVLNVPVYLQYFAQPFYRRAHTAVLQDVREFFHAALSQEK